MSSFGNSNIPSGASTDFASGALPNVGSNIGNFSTGMGSIDPNAGLNSLGGPLMGPNAGTIPNGFATAGNASSNYATPQGQGTGGGSGLSPGSLNGNVSFAMPADSMGQLNAQSLQNGLAAGAKLANSPSSGTKTLPTGSGRVSMKGVNFNAPVADFAGSNSGSQAGNSLLQLLQKYRPGAQ
jgi:hypothetical protein